MSALAKKLLFDLKALFGQALSIALVVACGVTSYITMKSAFDSLTRARDRYYEENRFSNVFVSLKRAPLSARSALENINGVKRLETRVVQMGLVLVPSLNRPASGPFVGLRTERSEAMQNRIHLSAGRMLDPTRSDEALVLQSFAEAHRLRPGDSLEVVLSGKRRNLRIAGIALSPEYLMTMTPGQMTYDPKTAPAVWVNESALSTAFQMSGAFNSAVMELDPNADAVEVRRRVDQLLRPYGGLGAVSRDKQPSNAILSGELAQLEGMAHSVPYLFLFVAAILVNVVLSRTIQLERGAIATLKALGYRDRTIAGFYLALVAIIVTAGALLGTGLGGYAGRAMMNLYTGQFFRFPSAAYVLTSETILVAVISSLAIALLGALYSVNGILRMPPAVAMQPPAPPRYRRSLLERIGLFRIVGSELKMVWREVSRRPIRLTLSITAIALSIAVVVVARSMWDSTEYLIDVQFHRSMREDLTITFRSPVAPTALSSLRQLPGVLRVEGLRSVPVRIVHGHASRDSVLIGYPKESSLRVVLDDEAKRQPIAEQGVTLTRKLAEILDARAGDSLVLELREGAFNTVSVQLNGTVNEPFGLQGHLPMEELNRLVGDSGAVNTALMLVDPREIATVERRLKQMPQVLSVSSPGDFRKQFNEQSAASLNVFSIVMLLFAGIIAVGVIYNNARVSLSQRARELGSLRILGYTKAEIARVLLSEQALQVVLAIAPGLCLGRFFAVQMFAESDPEAYRIPVVVASSTYAFAVLVAAASMLFSFLLLRRKLERLDLIAVLKTRE